MSGVLVHEQVMTATSNWSGEVPTTTPVGTQDIVKKYPTDTKGGIFDFGITEPHWIVTIQLLLGGQTTWTLSIIDADDDEIVIWTGTTEGAFVAFEGDKILLIEGQRLKLVSTGSPTTVMKARIALSKA